eukprot:PhF_6_TR42932/c0_g1_i2/m.65158
MKHVFESYCVVLLVCCFIWLGFAASTSYVTTETSTYDEVCNALNDASITDVVLNTFIPFDNPCPLQLVDRGEVRITCLKRVTTIEPHLKCPKSLPCITIAAVAGAMSYNSYNSSLLVIGCSIVGGGFLQVDDSPINITINNCTYTTNKLSTSSEFLRYHNTKSFPSDNVVIQISNTLMEHIWLTSLASCVRIFESADKVEGGVKFVLDNVTVSDCNATTTSIMVGLDLSGTVVPKLVSVWFTSVTIRNVRVLFLDATGGILMANVTGYLENMRCVHCVGQTSIANTRASSGFLSFAPGVDVLIRTTHCEYCKGDWASAVFASKNSSIIAENLTVTWGNATGAVAVLDQSHVKISNMYVE